MPGQRCPGKPTAKRIMVGSQEVGIAGFDEIVAKALEHVHGTDEEQRSVLLRELKAHSYVPAAVEKEYLAAVWAEFKTLRAQKLGQVEEQYHGIPREEIPWFPTIDYEKCTSCGVCAEFCKRGIYTMDDAPKVTDPYRCVVSCTGCKGQCKEGAISFPTLIELREVMKELRKKYGILTD